MEDRADQQRNPQDRGDHAGHPSSPPVPYSDELLVDLVSARENLYDKGRVDYKDEAVRAAAWDSIANTFGMRGKQAPGGEEGGRRRQAEAGGGRGRRRQAGAHVRSKFWTH
jgi:hypothetical protein